MARTASGSEHIEAARHLLKSARTADELRLAQSVLLPLELGLSIEQTALIIGRSVGATCTMRTRFNKVTSGKIPAPRSKRELRNRAYASLEREREILEKIFASKEVNAEMIVPKLKPMIEAELGQSLSLASVYRMLARHGWRTKLTYLKPQTNLSHQPAMNQMNGIKSISPINTIEESNHLKDSKNMPTAFYPSL